MPLHWGRCWPETGVRTQTLSRGPGQRPFRTGRGLHSRGPSLELPGRAGRTPAAGSPGLLSPPGRDEGSLSARRRGPGARGQASALRRESGTARTLAEPPARSPARQGRRRRPPLPRAGGPGRALPPPPAPRAQGDPAPPASPGRSSRPPSRRLHHSARSPCCRM